MHGSAKLFQALCCIDLEKFTRGAEWPQKSQSSRCDRKPALQSQLPMIFVLGPEPLTMSMSLKRDQVAHHALQCLRLRIYASGGPVLE